MSILTMQNQPTWSTLKLKLDPSSDYQNWIFQIILEVPVTLDYIISVVLAFHTEHYL